MTKTEKVFLIIALIAITVLITTIITNEKICKPRLKQYFDINENE